MSGEAREKLAADLKKAYESGSSIRDLTVKFRRSYGFIYKLLYESGVVLRGRGGVGGVKRPRKSK